MTMIAIYIVSLIFCYLRFISQAYFLRAIHTDPRGWKKLIIITNEWHMARVRATFTSIFSLPSLPHPSTHAGSSNDQHAPSREEYSLKFESVSNHLAPAVLELREKRERQSLKTFAATTAPSLRHLADVHQFLFMKHKAYSSERLTEGYVREKMDSELLKSY